jgi:methionyl-tRNA formyltransferase
MVTLRLVFFGTPAFAAAALARLLRSPHPVVAVVTQPDRPRGRGHHVSFGPVKQLAIDAGLPVLQPDRLRTPEFLRDLQNLNADLGVVAAYGKILPEAVINAFPRGMINIHASILPKYRGAAPVHRAVMAGEAETGVSIMRVVKELDAGAVFAVARRPIAPDETSADVEAGLAALGADLCAAVIDDIAAGVATELPQDPSEATYAARITKEEAALDWSRPALALHNRIRGLHPWPHAQAWLGAERLLLLRSTVEDSARTVGTPGEIVRAAGDDLAVATGAGILRLLHLQPEGRRPMTAREFLAGRRLGPGARLTAAPDPRP